jgi:hypothetical protein
MKNTKNTKLVGFEPMSKAETAKVLGGKGFWKKAVKKAVAKRPKKK